MYEKCHLNVFQNISKRLTLKDPTLGSPAFVGLVIGRGTGPGVPFSLTSVPWLAAAAAAAALGV